MKRCRLWEKRRTFSSQGPRPEGNLIDEGEVTCEGDESVPSHERQVARWNARGWSSEGRISSKRGVAVMPQLARRKKTPRDVIWGKPQSPEKQERISFNTSERRKDIRGNDFRLVSASVDGKESE